MFIHNLGTHLCLFYSLHSKLLFKLTKIMCIYQIQHNVLKCVYIVEWLNQANSHALLHRVIIFCGEPSVFL